MQTAKEKIKLLRFWAAKKKQGRIDKEVALRSLGAKEVGKISKRDRFIAGLALYWSEGYKNANQEVGFTNSDPAMITFFIRWLKEEYKIEPARLILRVSINILHEYRVKGVEKYWGKITGVPLSQFTKTSLIKTTSKKRYQNESVHFGTLRVKVRNGTDLRRKILGSIGQLKTVD